MREKSDHENNRLNVLLYHSVSQTDEKKIFLNSEKKKEFPFLKTNLIVRVRPIKDVRDISILWSVDPTRDLYRSNPCRLIGFLLGK